MRQAWGGQAARESLPPPKDSVHLSFFFFLDFWIFSRGVGVECLLVYK